VISHADWSQYRVNTTCGSAEPQRASARHARTDETMTTMVGTVPRTLRRLGLPILCCAILTSAALIGGCARVVSGTARAGDPQTIPARPIPVIDLLIDPTRFPTQYPAAVLSPTDVDRVLTEIDGVPVGFEVVPPECAPLPVLAQQKAAVQGTDVDGGTRLTVTVIRSAPSVRARATQLAECPSFTRTAGGESGEESEVTVDLPPAPPVDADDSYAVDLTVTSTSSDEPATRTLTLVALVDDVRVTASWQQQGSSQASPDTQALDALFTDAVLKVRRALPR
jgi:hypothetical protein